MTSLIAVVSVGSTSFSPLIQAALSLETLTALTSFGVRELIVQHGNVQPVIDPSLLVGNSATGYTFVDSQGVHLTISLRAFVAVIDQLLGSAKLAITHAGAGSILAALKPMQKSEVGERRLIVVPNDTLMDSHQSDLAEEIVRSGCGVSCGPSTLAQTITSLNTIQTGRMSMNDPNTKDGPIKFRALLDREMGFIPS